MERVNYQNYDQLRGKYLKFQKQTYEYELSLSNKVINLQKRNKEIEQFLLYSNIKDSKNGIKLDILISISVLAAEVFVFLAIFFLLLINKRFLITILDKIKNKYIKTGFCLSVKILISTVSVVSINLLFYPIIYYSNKHKKERESQKEIILKRSRGEEK